MTVGELHKRVRRRLDDAIGSPTDQLWKQDEIIDEHLNDVCDAMCRIARKIIKDWTTVAEVLATGTVTITGAAGQIDTLKVNGTTIMTGPVAFVNNVTDTATAIKNAINAYVYPATYLGVQYTASSALGVVTISAKTPSGSTPNGYVVAATSSGGLTATTVDMAGGSSLCKMYLVPGQQVYQKHKKILETPFIRLDGVTRPLDRKSEADMDYEAYGWQTTEGTPYAFIEEKSTIRFINVPDVAYTANLTVYRRPLTVFTAVDLDVEISEIDELYHKDLIIGILAECFDKNDEETLRPGLAQKYAAQFRARCLEIAGEIVLTTGGPSTNGCNQAAFI